MSTQLAVMDTRYGFTQDQIEVIKATIAPGATNDELSLFLMVCQKTGLDPFSRQIYLSERKSKDQNTGQWISKKTPETTIDGFRVIAERSNEYEGQVGPFWCGPEGEWKDVWLALDSMPSAAKVGVWRKGFRDPVWGVALFEEYKQTKADGKLNSMWQKMGANQLAKCAESLALRKAFPRDLSGMYSKEEMAQAEDRGSKQAQADVAERRIKELSAPVYAPGPEAFKEVQSWKVDSTATTEPIDPTYEQRHAALILEANAMLEEPAKTVLQDAADTFETITKPKPQRKRGSISFEALKKWGEIKAEILKLTGTTDLYYKALAAGGYQHADEIKSAEDAAKIWKALKEITAELAPVQRDKALSDELSNHRERLGGDKFLAVLGACGFESLKHLVDEGNGQQVQTVLDELKGNA